MRNGLALVLALAHLTVWAAGVEPRSFGSQEEQARYRSMISELRCLVCQNQNLADSDADLAKDLRDQVYEMMKAGKSDADIKTYMENRYGDFVLYRPPVKSTTYLLWFGPVLLLSVGITVALFQIRRRRRAPAPAELSTEEHRRIDALLTGAGKETQR
jgi:cytochrome c-type biogenesis protein CcmH